MTAKHIITLPDHELTRSAERRSKFWFKILRGVDRNQSTGYAFEGDFSKHNATIEVPSGTWLMSYVEDVRSSGRMDGRNVTLYQVRNRELVEVDSWYLDAAPGWALHVRDQVADYMEAKPEPEPAVPSVDDLLAEREQLLARLAEIDAMLPEPEGTEVSTRQAAQALGVSVRTVQRWAATGKVQAVKDQAGRWVITITINQGDN